ncbi:hypothetical protein AB0P28_00385 [Pseudarthrobacter sp. NPDC089323]
MTTLLRDVFDIPERAGVEDYVLRLTDSVAGEGGRHALEDYVVTPALADAFDGGLGLVADALRTGLNRGAFLTGSFGSGKSHFMAVLHALLRRVPEARSIVELQPVVARYDTSLEQKAILPLAFHFLDGASMEQVLFDGYIRQIKVLHPQAPLPAFFPSDALLGDAERMRATLGTEPFLQGLGGEGGDDEWSGLLGSSSWDENRYHAARAAAPQSTERQALVSALVEKYFTSYSSMSKYVDLDTGLEAMSNHARALGFDAVVLFLDELVLWLAFGMHEKDFFRRESQKLTKLVEGSYGSLPTPLISFVARQMDLRKWLADSGASGAQQEILESAFRHQEGRFSKIELGDDNLPFVASKRLLKPKDSAAARAIDDAFARLERTPQVWDVLLDGVNADDQHRGSDEKAFRLTYPFAPALVSTLRTLASVMQRDRTALKVMQQMLVDRREKLSIDDVIPAGDCYDYVVKSQGGAVLDAQVAALFRSAIQLYEDKLRPTILRSNNLTEADVADSAKRPRYFEVDDRLAKTLLLSAVAPGVPALKALTAARLASLNHGSIITPLPGGEASVVLAKVKEWSKAVPEIHVAADGLNPVISVQLSDVDYESIVDKAKGEDNPGRQREAVKDLISESFGIDLGAQDVYGAYRHTMVWRGSKRDVELVFGNVRDVSWLSDDHFRASPGAWRFVIDHPFDEDQHSAQEDVRRVEGLIARNGFTERTVVWVPKFLSDERRRDLRRYVILDWLLTSDERWTQHANHLGEVDRLQAKNILEAQHRTLKETLSNAIKQAYGAATPTVGTLQDDVGHEKVLYSLDPTFEPAPPVGATLGEAFRRLASHAFDATYPGHPKFEPGDAEVRVVDLKNVLAHLERAVADPERRIEIDSSSRALLARIANPLEVGKASEQFFNFGDDYFGSWGVEIVRGLTRVGKEETGSVTVSDLRSAIDGIEPPKGLRPEVSDLVILGWGLLRQRAWFQHGGSIPTPAPGTLQPAMELRPQPMPNGEDWSKARDLAQRIFGIDSQTFMTPTSVAKLAEEVRAAAQNYSVPANSLVAALEDVTARLSHDGGSRLRLARSLAELVDSLRQLGGVPLIERLAAAEFNGTPEEAGRSLKTAEHLTSAIKGFQWDRLSVLSDAIRNGHERADSAQRVLDALTSAFAQHEYETSASAALTAAMNGVFDWLAGNKPTASPPPVTQPKQPDDVVIDLPSSSTRVTRSTGDKPKDEILDELWKFLDENKSKKVRITWEVVE